MNELQNISEVLFEKFLRSNGLSFEFEKHYPGKSKLVDYTVSIEGRDFLFEVKQFEQKNNPFPQGVTALDPSRAIRAKIEQASCHRYGRVMSMPISAMASTANGFRVLGSIPALIAVKTFIGYMPEIAFRHLTTSRIAGTQK